MSTPVTGKRKRTNNEGTNFPDVETVETTTETGLRLVQQLKRSQYKNGRDIAFHFLDLPSKDDYPDYFQQTAMPLSLNMIEQQLKAGYYDTMEKLESDLKRLIQNAKDYNDSKSEVYLDAERIRKALSNFMPKHNPAYLNPDYKATPTPIPQALLDRLRESSVSTNTSALPVKIKLKNSRHSIAPSATPEPEEDLQGSFMEVLEELSAQESAVNFEKRPPKRDYPDYYKVIERPTSISDVKIMVQQNKVTDWNALAREVRLIWTNAKEYNEPGSAIYDMTEELEQWFEERVKAAGADSPKAPQRLSLSQPKKSGLKLKLGGSTPTPSFSGVSVDSNALRRQREETQQALRASRGDSKSVNTPAPSTAPSMTRSLSSVEPNGDTIMAGMNGVGPGTPVAVHDATGAQKQSTPALNSMVPPQVNGTRPSEAPRNVFSESDNPMERKQRDPGQGLKDALLGSVSYMTHPTLPGDPKWKLNVEASPSLTQVSSFTYLPASHYYFRVIPHPTPEIKARSNWKVCVSANWQPVQESPHTPGAYDFRLQPGENTILVDAIASLRQGEKKEYAPAQMQFDFERIQLVVILMDRAD